MREKLRLRLTKRKEEQPKREEQQPVIERDGGVEDHRRVEDLLQFINSADSKPASSSKAAKRARHKQKKVKVPISSEVFLFNCHGNLQSMSIQSKPLKFKVTLLAYNTAVFFWVKVVTRLKMYFSMCFR